MLLALVDPGSGFDEGRGAESRGGESQRLAREVLSEGGNGDFGDLGDLGDFSDFGGRLWELRVRAAEARLRAAACAALCALTAVAPHPDTLSPNTPSEGPQGAPAS